MPCSICRKKGHNARTCKSTHHVEERIEYLRKALKNAEREKHYARASETHFRVKVMSMRESCNSARKRAAEAEKKLEKKDETIKGLRNKEKGMCNICFEELPLGDEYATKCGHTFHTGCLLKWLEKNNTCPCCRGELYEKYVIPEEYMSDEEYLDEDMSDDDMPELEEANLDDEGEEKAPVEEESIEFSQFELDVYQSMTNTFGNVVMHPEQTEWVVDRDTLLEHIVQYTNYLIPEDPEHPVRVENIAQLLRDWTDDDVMVGADPLDDLDIADAIDLSRVSDNVSSAILEGQVLSV